MAFFRVKAGIHIGPDLSQKPVKRKDPVTGEVTERYPSKTFRTGERVESDTDLVAKHGAGKFEFVGESNRPGKQFNTGGEHPHGFATPGDPTPEIAAGSPTVFPAGQVATGYQQSGVRDESGRQVSGPISRQELEDRGIIEPTAEQAPRQQAQKGPQPRPASHAGITQQTTPKPPPNLEALTVKELHDYAAEEEIDLKGAKTKEEILRAIRSAK